MNLYLSFFILCLISLFSIASSKKAVLAGGGLDDDNHQVYTAFIKLATPANGDPYIGIITAASGTPQDNGKFYVDLFHTYNVKNVEWIPIDVKHIDSADDPAIVEKISKMSGIFFGGGDQKKLIQCFYKEGRKDTATLSQIRKMYEAGELAIGGTSAGTDIHQKLPMVTGGESWDALAYGAFDHDDPDFPDNLSYDIEGGFGFFTYGFLDTHFGTRGRQGRMIRLMYDLSSYGTKGVGIDENTAIVMQDGKFEVVGYNGVYVFDITNAKIASRYSAKPLSLDNIQVTYLTKGDVFNMEDESVVFADFKQNIKGREQHQYPPLGEVTDIFGSYRNKRIHSEMFTNVTVDLFNSALANQRYGFTFETDPSFRIDLTKTVISYGVIGVKDDTTYVSFRNLKMKIS